MRRNPNSNNIPVAIPVGESRGVSEEDKSFLKDFFVDFIQNYAGPKTRANLATGIVCFAAAAGCWSWLGSSSVLGLTGTVGFAALGLRNSYQGLLGNYSAKSMDNYRKKNSDLYEGSRLIGILRNMSQEERYKLLLEAGTEAAKNTASGKKVMTASVEETFEVSASEVRNPEQANLINAIEIRPVSSQQLLGAARINQSQRDG